MGEIPFLEGCVDWCYNKEMNVSFSFVALINNSTYKTEEFRETCRQRQLGIKLSEETKKKQSETLKGKPKEKIECPHCGKIGKPRGMKCWHFDKCKEKK